MPLSEPAYSGEDLPNLAGWDQLLYWCHMVQENNAQITRLSLLEQPHTVGPAVSEVDWEVQQVVSLVSLMDQKLANSEPPTAPEFWQDAARTTGRSEPECQKFAMEYLVKLSARDGLSGVWNRKDDMLFEAGLIAYGADPELWNKLRVLLPDKSVGMLKDRYKRLWKLCENIPVIPATCPVFV